MIAPYGWIDDCDGKKVTGWIAAKHSPLDIEIVINDITIANYRCNLQRPDIEKRLDANWHGSGFNIPFTINEPSVVQIKCAITHTELNGCPFLYTPKQWLSLADLKRIPNFQKFLSYDADQVAGLLITQDINSNAFKTGFVSEHIKLAPLYSCKKKLTGLVWFYPLLNIKLVQLNKTTTDCQRIAKLHQFFDSQNNCISGFKVPSLLASIDFKTNSSQSKQSNALIYQHIEALQTQTVAEQQFRIRMISALLDLSNLKYQNAMQSNRLGLNQAARDIKKVLKQKEPFLEKVSTLKLLLRFWRLPRVFSHGDAHRENWLIEQNSHELYLIDWSHHGKRHLGYDIACLINDQELETAATLLKKALEPFEQAYAKSIESAVMLSLFYIRHIQNNSHLHQKRQHKILLGTTSA